METTTHEIPYILLEKARLKYKTFIGFACMVSYEFLINNNGPTPNHSNFF